MDNSSSFNEAIDSLISYCNYQERCSSEIIQKLRSFDLTESEQELIVTELKERSIFDDNRYVTAFISGKFRIKKWGKVKIKAALRSKRIADSIIDIGFDENLDMEKYLEQLELLFSKKWNLLKNKSDYNTRQKMYRYLSSKGYESQHINELFNRFLTRS